MREIFGSEEGILVQNGNSFFFSEWNSFSVKSMMAEDSNRKSADAEFRELFKIDF